MLENTLHRWLLGCFVDSRNEVIMFKVGDLVRYKKSSVLGLVIALGDKNNELVIRWADNYVSKVHKLYIEKVAKN